MRNHVATASRSRHTHYRVKTNSQGSTNHQCQLADSSTLRRAKVADLAKLRSHPVSVLQNASLNTQESCRYWLYCIKTQCHVQMYIFSPMVIRQLLFLLLSCMYFSYVHRFMYVITCQLYFIMTTIWVTKFRVNV